MSLITIYILTIFIVFLFAFFFFFRAYLLKAKTNRALLNKIQTLTKQQKVLQNKLAKAQKKEKKLQKLHATREKFFSLITHDLKNSFNVLIGFSELLIQKHKKQNSEETKKILHILNDTASFGFSLLENLLLWSRSQRGDIAYTPKNYNLHQLLQKNFEFFQAMAANKKIHLQINIPNPLFVHCDANMLNTIVRNLLNNAIKFTKSGGQVSLTAAKTETGVEVSVVDNGTGISIQAQKTLFNSRPKPIHPGTANESGTGLGLLLCREFVKKNKGNIWVQSTEGKGSTFTFTIPPAKPEKNE